MTNRGSKFACSRISRSSTFAMLFALHSTDACIFDISADQNVRLRSISFPEPALPVPLDKGNAGSGNEIGLRSALRSLRLYRNSLFCYRLRLFAICDLRSTIVCDHMKTSLKSNSTVNSHAYEKRRRKC